MMVSMGAALTGAIAIVRLNHNEIQASMQPTPIVTVVLPPLGVTGTMRSDRGTQEVNWTSLDLARTDQSAAEPSIPAGPFEGEFIVTFQPGKVRHALVGALIQGGSIIVMHEGQVLLSDFADASAEKIVLTRLPHWLPLRHEQLTYAFKTDGSGPIRFQPYWQPEGTERPVPLPSVQPRVAPTTGTN